MGLSVCVGVRKAVRLTDKLRRWAGGGLLGGAYPFLRGCCGVAVGGRGVGCGLTSGAPVVAVTSLGGRRALAGGVRGGAGAGLIKPPCGWWG